MIFFLTTCILVEIYDIDSYRFNFCVRKNSLKTEQVNELISIFQKPDKTPILFNLIQKHPEQRDCWKYKMLLAILNLQDLQNTILFNQDVVIKKLIKCVFKENDKPFLLEKYLLNNNVLYVKGFVHGPCKLKQNQRPLSENTNTLQ